ncbi:M81 family metallopeptidase [Phaeobacter sp. BS52]|uniref:M81 family metallopeptidase n=1 Tax=Phaeobacter sp. BS52 TaxID=2907241 RepID=UPI003870AA73
MTRPRIAIAGFQHETNCHGLTQAGLAEFEMADSWPGMLHGQKVITQTRGMNLPIAGFANAAEIAGYEIIPILWCAAEPSAHVTDHAFETISGMILDALRAAGPLDGVYLDLHGAMVTESFADGEGELLRRVRAQIGEDIPLVASLDLHANVSAEMCAHADYLAIFRTYPHLDMAETGARCQPVLARLLRGEVLHKALRPVPYLIPLHAQYTGSPPFSTLYGSLPDLQQQGVEADIALGFTAADFPDTGPSCVAYAKTAAQAEAAVDTILSHFLAMEDRIDRSLLSLDAAVQLSHHRRDKPLILADVQDNPGAGGTSDTTGLLRALIDGKCRKVLSGMFHDPELAQKAHAAGSSARFKGELGSKSGVPGQTPVTGLFEVLSLSDGDCPYTGEMYGGGIATLGKSAALRIVDAYAQIDVVVTSIRNQCLDLAHFTHFGLDPTDYQTICVKSTVHYRAAFDPIASEVKSVTSPGVFACDLRNADYQNLPSGKRAEAYDQYLEAQKAGGGSS